MLSSWKLKLTALSLKQTKVSPLTFHISHFTSYISHFTYYILLSRQRYGQQHSEDEHVAGGVPQDVVELATLTDAHHLAPG